MPRFGVRGDTKIIVRPRGGLDLRRVSDVALAAAVKNAAGVELPAASEDLVCINGTQNVIVISCSCKERARKYVGITALKMGDTLYEARAYATVPEGCAKGVIRGIPLTHTRKQIEEALLGPRNPSLIAAERIGSSGAVIVVFEGEVVPSRVVYDSVVLRCTLYRKHYEDPSLVRGSLRENLDRTGSRSDEELWRVLREAHLADFVTSQAKGLSLEVGDGGSNLSAGQRQLVCLARALIRKPKVLLLDEATSQMDGDTDRLIQATLRESFAGCTLLAIAHRINTVLDYDKILVMGDGRVLEYGPVDKLLGNTNSLFPRNGKRSGGPK
ncbi:hypothetical protein ISCGN_024145 [Ixodes scapularis]